MPKRNRLLAALALADRALLRPHLVERTLEAGTTLFEAHAPITHVYFPHSGTISLLVVTSDGSHVQAGVIGNEGVVGLGGLLSGDVSFARQIVQQPGRAAVIDRAPFLEAVNASATLRALLSVHSDFVVAQVLQSAACHALHSVEQRVARQLLEVDDRLEGDEIPLTQQLLADILGVRRASVTLAARNLQSAELISYQRGRLTIKNRKSLEETACECYAILKELHRDQFAPKE